MSPLWRGGEEVEELRHLLRTLRAAPKLSNFIVSKLPTTEQVMVTLRNVSWVMEYWQAHNSRVDTPLDGTNGFERCPDTKMVIFSDHRKKKAVISSG